MNTKKIVFMLRSGFLFLRRWRSNVIDKAQIEIRQEMIHAIALILRVEN